MADQPTHNAATSMSSASTTRRTLLKGFAAAGAAISMSSKVAWADGEIGYWAKDLPPEKLIEMYSTILRIRWFERTLADKHLDDRSFRNLIHLYAGQEAVATGVCAALNNKGPFEQLDVIFGTHRPTGNALAKGVDMKKLAAEYNSRRLASTADTRARCTSLTSQSATSVLTELSVRLPFLPPARHSHSAPGATSRSRSCSVAMALMRHPPFIAP